MRVETMHEIAVIHVDIQELVSEENRDTLNTLLNELDEIYIEESKQ